MASAVGEIGGGFAGRGSSDRRGRTTPSTVPAGVFAHGRRGLGSVASGADCRESWVGIGVVSVLLHFFASSFLGSLSLLPLTEEPDKK